jgi:hypothetical protein
MAAGPSWLQAQNSSPSERWKKWEKKSITGTGSSSLPGDDGPCGDYRLDMAGAQFGDCKCGYSKAACQGVNRKHVQSQSVSPSLSNTPSPALQSGKKGEWQAVKPKSKPLPTAPQEPENPFSEWMRIGFTSSAKQEDSYRRSQTLDPRGGWERRKDDVQVAKQIAAQFAVPGQYLEACHSGASKHGMSFSLTDLMRLTTAILHAPISEVEKMQVLGRLQNGDVPTAVAAELKRVAKGEPKAGDSSLGKIAEFFGGAQQQQQQKRGSGHGKSATQSAGLERSYSASMVPPSQQQKPSMRHSVSSSNMVASMTPSQQRALMQRHMEQRATPSANASHAHNAAAFRQKRTQSCATTSPSSRNASAGPPPPPALGSPAMRALRKSGKGKGQCAKLKMKLATWEESVQKYWKMRNRLYAVSDEVKFFVMDGHSLLQEGLRLDTTSDFTGASVNYGNGLAKWEIALTMIPSESIVAKLLGNHTLDFGKRKEEIDVFINKN